MEIPILPIRNEAIDENSAKYSKHVNNRGCRDKPGSSTNKIKLSMKNSNLVFINKII